MKKDCLNCKYFAKRATELPCIICGNEEPFGKYEPQTNADRIRAMSDEELAEFLEGASIAGCPEPARSCRANCIDCILDWLREPVKDGDNK